MRTGVYEKNSEEMEDVIEAAFAKADVEDEIEVVGIEVALPVIVEAHVEVLYRLSRTERMDSHHRCCCCCCCWY